MSSCGPSAWLDAAEMAEHVIDTLLAGAQRQRDDTVCRHAARCGKLPGLVHDGATPRRLAAEREEPFRFHRGVFDRVVGTDLGAPQPHRSGNLGLPRIVSEEYRVRPR